MAYFCGVEQVRGGRRSTRNRTGTLRLATSHAKFARLEPLEGRVLFDAVALDPQFGVGGRSRVDVAGLADYAAAVHRLDDGKILVAGAANFGLDGQAAPVRRAFVARLTADGALDGSFGNAGIATYGAVTSTPSVSAVNVLAVGRDGRIFVGGSMAWQYESPPTGTTGTVPTFAVAAFTADGQTIPAFGQGGVAWYDVAVQGPGGEQAVDDLVVQADGDVVATGVVQRAGADHAELATLRFNADGTFDTVFGVRKLRLEEDDRPDYWADAAVALQPDGKVVVLAKPWSGNVGAFVLGRYHPNGTPDETFGEGGRVDTPIERPGYEAVGVGAEQGFVDLVVQSDGKIAAVGKVFYWEVELLRYNADGSADTSFGGGDGRVTLNTAAINDGDLAEQPGGRLALAVVGSHVRRNPTSPPPVEGPARLSVAIDEGLHASVTGISAAGDVAWTFKRSGSVPVGHESLAAVELQPDGKLLSVGTAYPTLYADEGVAWYETGDALVVKVDPQAVGPDHAPAPTDPPVPYPPIDPPTSPGGPVVVTPEPIPAPIFLGRPSVRGGKFYKFSLGYVSTNLARSTPVVVEGPAGVSSPAAMLRVREKRAKPRAAAGGSTAFATATYRVAAPGGRFDSTDNGTYTIRTGLDATWLQGTPLGQFQVNSRAKPPRAGATELRRIVVPAHVTGVLRNDVAAVGGETTGWGIQHLQAPPGAVLNLDVTAVLDDATRLAGRRVVVVGTFKTVTYTERGEVRVLVATSVRAAS